MEDPLNSLINDPDASQLQPVHGDARTGPTESAPPNHLQAPDPAVPTAGLFPQHKQQQQQGDVQDDSDTAFDQQQQLNGNVEQEQQQGLEQEQGGGEQEQAGAEGKQQLIQWKTRSKRTVVLSRNIETCVILAVGWTCLPHNQSNVFQMTKSGRTVGDRHTGKPWGEGAQHHKSLMRPPDGTTNFVARSTCCSTFLGSVPLSVTAVLNPNKWSSLCT